MKHRIVIKKIKKISNSDIDAIYNLILQGAEVKRYTLNERLLNTEIIAYCKLNSKIVGTAALKIPNDEYFDSVFVKSNSVYNYNDFKYELGYIYVDKEFRKQGIAQCLCKKIINKYLFENIYSTVRLENISIQKLLTKIGFILSGREFFNRDHSEKLRLYIKRKKNEK